MSRQLLLVLLPLLASPAVARAEGPAPAQTSTAAKVAAGFDAEATLARLRGELAGIEEQLRQTDSKVAVLRSSSFGGVIARTTAIVVHQNELGAAYQLERIVYTLDGKVVFAKEDAAQASVQPKLVPVFDGPINAGKHEVRASLVYSGAGYGPFTYLKGYRFKVESAHAFDVAEGRRTTLRVVSHERSDFSSAPADRIGIRYDLDVSDARPVSSGKR